MKIKLVEVNGVKLKAPSSYIPPSVITDCCGAGEGWGELVVPDSILGLRISEACSIHDHSWEVAERQDFDLTNTIFLENILTIIDTKSANGFMRWIRRYRAMTYYSSVQDLGESHFLALKAAQERIKKEG